jgi:hypothetical protein
VSNDALARLRIELPESERGRGAFDLRELDRINARLERNAYRPARGKTALEQRDDDLARRDALERQPGLKADGKWQREAVAETQALAEARGEEVSEDRSGVKRILDRDPLLSLARSSKITPEQLETGQEVRELYDRRGEDAGAMEYTGMPSGGHNHEHFVAKRFERAKACEMIGRIERAVVVICSAEPASLTMLRVVCERGMSVASQGKGRAFDRNAAALARALDVADDVLRRRA